MDPVIAKYLLDHPKQIKGTGMNPHAVKHFAENPETKYWYYNYYIRVPNPALNWKPDWVDDPWPAAHETLNATVGCDCQ